MSVLSIRELRKSYGAVQALKGISFEVPEGSVFGILGPNGSGKTTLLGIVLDVLMADAGAFSWLGNTSPANARKQIGSLLETPNFYHYLSAWDNLGISAAIKGHGLADRERVLKLVRLWERKDSKFSTYSLGMKQRLAIASALLGSPKVLVFDEPMNGLDPAGIAEIRELMRSLHREGYTIIMASHLLDEVERVCTHMAIMKSGTLITSGSVEELMRSEDGIEVRAADMAALKSALTALPGLPKIMETGHAFHVPASNGLTAEGINRHCMENGVVLQHLVIRKKSLETAFMELTGN